MFNWLRKWKARRQAPSPVDRQRARVESMRLKLRAAYDAAQTTDENRKHWANADNLSAAAANSLDVRKKLRERSRYERENNSYYEGIVQTLANHLAGPGPRLQVTTPDQALNTAIESAWKEWAEATRFADQLRTLKQSKTVDGEAFCIFRTNESLPTAVKLDIDLVECDHVTTPDFSSWKNPNAVDGIVFDGNSNPSEYHVLRSHPGDNLLGFGNQYDRLSARQVLHWYRCDRPGQVRGVPEAKSGLPLFALLRRFELATLNAAETAALFAVLLESTNGGDPSDPGSEAWDALDVERGMMTTLPDGYKMSQLEAEHPNTNMEMFVRLILRAIARCLSIPFNIAAGDSSSFNFSSARLDHLIYRDAMVVERQDCEREVLDQMLKEFYLEAAYIPGLLPGGSFAYLVNLPHKWHWPAWAMLDPVSEADADEKRLRNGTTTLATVCAERGEDWQQVIRQRAKERAFEAQVVAELGAASASANPSDPQATATQGQGAAVQGDVQATALNGAQITSLLSIVTAVATGQLPADSAKASLLGSFPLMAPTLIDQIIAPLLQFSPVQQALPAMPPQAAAAALELMIQAAAPPSALHICGGTGSLTIQAAASADLPPFEMLAYTGGTLPLPNFNLPVVVDLAGMTIPNQRLPVLRDHKQFKVIGHTERIEILDGSRIVAGGVVSGTGSDAREVRATAGNGFPWQCSIGASVQGLEHVPPGVQAQANGQTFTGPVYIARRSTLREISFVPIGADGNATASVAATLGGFDMTFEQWCLGFMTMEEFQKMTDDQKKILQKVYDSLGLEPVPTDPASMTTPLPPATATSPIGATAGGLAIAGSATVPMIQAGNAVVPQGVGIAQTVQQMRQETANEMQRQRDVLRIANDPSLETEISVNGRRQRVNVQQHAIAAGWSPNETELVVLRASRSSSPHLHFSSGTPAVTGQTIEAALCQTLGMQHLDRYFQPQVLEAAGQQFRSLGLQQILLITAAQNGYHAGPGSKVTAANIRAVLKHAFIEASGFSTVSLPGIFSNVANKELLQGYTEEDESWREISRVASATDFKSQTCYRLNDSMEYEELGPSGEIKHGEVSEETYSRKVDTYAKMAALTRTMIINDDLSAFDDLRTRLGAGAKKKFNNIFWAKFMNNAAFFTAGRGNYITGATSNLLVDGVGLQQGLTAFRKLKSADNKRIGGRPSLLLVPPELEFTADRLYQSTNVNTGGAATAETVGNANIHANKYKPLVVDWLSDPEFTGYSTTAWYLLRMANILAAVVVSFLNGQQTPTVESTDADFDTLGIQFRGYHDFGVDQAEYLCGVKSKGAA